MYVSEWMLQPLSPQKKTMSIRIFKSGVRNRIKFDKWEENYYASRLGIKPRDDL